MAKRTIEITTLLFEDRIIRENNQQFKIKIAKTKSNLQSKSKRHINIEITFCSKFPRKIAL